MDCAKVPVVADTLKRIERLLGPACHPFGREATDLALLALRALGNAGAVSGDDILRTCYEDPANSPELRVGAISALRRIPCGHQRDSNVLRLFSNTSEDVEVRIAAYLAVMQCPTLSALRAVKEGLYTEQVNQGKSAKPDFEHFKPFHERINHW